MNKEYNKNEKKQKNAMKKYRKALLKVVGFLFVAALGFGISGGLLADFFIKITLSSELAVFLSVLVKAAMMGGGALLAAINGIKARKLKKDMDILEDEEQEIVEYLEKVKNDQEEKVQSLKNELDKAKAMSKAQSKDEKSNKRLETTNTNNLENTYDNNESKVKRI